MKNISRKNKSYSENTHFYGRIWSIVSIVMMMVFPIVAGIVFDAWPTASAIGIGIMGILIYWAAGAVEFISYTPLLGATSIYLGFVTGNLSNLKVPCALSCIDAENAKSNTDEGDIIATVSTAVSSIVTTLVIIIGVILIAATPLADLLAKPAAQKAADYLLPALFGALAVVYVSRNPKISFPPVILMVALCIAIPKIESIISILVPFVALFTVGVARIMYKKGWLGKNEPEKTAVDVETNNVALDTEDTDKFIDELDNK